MTPTEIMREYRYWISTQKKLFKCKQILFDKCCHETRFRRALLKAFYAGYSIGTQEGKNERT